MFEVQSSDRRTRERFVSDTYNFIESIVNDQRAQWLVSGLSGKLASAWTSQANQDRFKLLSAAQANIPQRLLDAHGLEGDELDIKVEVVRHVWERFQRRGGSSLLKRLIDLIDNLIESMLSATGAGTAIKEIKDAVKGAIEED